MSSARIEHHFDSQRTSVIESLMTAIDGLPFILESEMDNRLFLRESMSFETFIPANIEVIVQDDGEGAVLRLRADSSGEGFYHDMHLKNLMDDIVRAVEDNLRAEPPVQRPLNDTGSIAYELSLLSELHSKGLLTDPEYELAKRKVLGRSIGR